MVEKGIFGRARETLGKNSHDRQMQSLINEHRPVINILKRIGPECSQDERTVIVENGTSRTIVSAYCPGQGEDMHCHPTENTLNILSGAFLTSVEKNGVVEQRRYVAGEQIYLTPNQPHCVEADASVGENSIIMVKIFPNKPTSDPDYSTPCGISSV